MERDSVWPAMAQAYQGAGGDLADRLFAALRAAQAEGGDLRGMQSAAILIVEAAPTGKEWGIASSTSGSKITPPRSMSSQRLIRSWRAYGHAERAEEPSSSQDLDRALPDG